MSGELCRELGRTLEPPGPGTEEIVPALLPLHHLLGLVVLHLRPEGPGLVLLLAGDGWLGVVSVVVVRVGQVGLTVGTTQVDTNNLQGKQLDKTRAMSYIGCYRHVTCHMSQLSHGRVGPFKGLVYS